MATCSAKLPKVTLNFQNFSGLLQRWEKPQTFTLNRSSPCSKRWLGTVTGFSVTNRNCATTSTGDTLSFGH